MLRQKNYTFPAIIVAVNGQQVPEEEYDSRTIDDGDNVRMLHLIAGG